MIKLIETPGEDQLSIFILRRGGLSEEKLRTILTSNPHFQDISVKAGGITSHKKETEDQ